MILILISILLLLSYFMLIGAISAGWWRLDEFKADKAATVKTSVIIAVRNEEANIAALLGSLFSQDYPHNLFEIIISDDHSTDTTIRQVEKYIAQHNPLAAVKLLTATAGAGAGKKNALTRGIQISSGELIVITDADCRAGVSWLSELAAFYQQHKPQMILAPVIMTDGGSLFGKLQSLEFMSLISTAAGSCNAGFPLLANGANIAFSRQAFESCGGFSDNINYASGDDMFLMLRISEKFGTGAIRFLRSAKAIVRTPSEQHFKAFLQQRRRWVSKSRGYTNIKLVAASILVFLTNLGLVATLGMAVCMPGVWKIALAFYFIKMLIDLPLMISFGRFQQSTRLLWLFPMLEILNAIYTFYIGLAGNLLKYEWKGRQFSV